MNKAKLLYKDNCILIRIPMKFKRIGGRKEIILPDGFESSDTESKPQDALIIAVARAYLWKDMLESGKVSSVADLDRSLNLDASFVGRILRLTLLSPAIIEAIVRGDEPSGLSLRTLTSQIPLSWKEQGQKFGISK